MNTKFSYHTDFTNRVRVKDCSSAQVMVNYRALPRDTRMLTGWGNKKQRLVIHEDYYRTVLRYWVMEPSRKQRFMREISMFLKSDPKGWDCDFRGLVIHMDPLLRQDMAEALEQYGATLTKEVLYNLVLKHMTGNLYDVPEAIADKLWKVLSIKSNELTAVEALEYEALEEFQMDLIRAMAGCDAKAFVLLENTTKTNKGRSIMSTLDKFRNLNLCKYVSRCFDIEHAYALGWLDDNWVNTVKLMVLNKEVHCVHLNTIPLNVEPGSRLDRHSSTTLDEGKLSRSSYEELQEFLDNHDIPAIREVDNETRERE